MWIARDKDQTLWLFENKPVREDDLWSNSDSDCMKLSDTTGQLFPDLKWEDEPIEVDLVFKGKTNKTDITVTRKNIIFNDSYWTALRNEAAVTAMQSILEKWNNVSLNSIVIEEACELSVDCADALIKKLKSKEIKI